jgi:hypothetical protein
MGQIWACFTSKSALLKNVFLGSMLCSLYFAIFDNFRREKLGFISKTNVMIKFLHLQKLAVVWAKKRQNFWRKYFLNRDIGPWPQEQLFADISITKTLALQHFFFPQKFFFSPNQNNLFKSRRKKWKSEKLFTNWIRRNLESTYNQSSPIYCRSMKRTTRRPFPFFHHRNLNIPLTPINKIRAQCEQSHFQIILWRCIYPLPRTQGCQNYLGTIYQNMKNIPNDQKYTKLTNNIPRERKIFQMTILGIHQHFTFQFCPKYTQKGIFWYANITSGNPPSALCSFLA